MGVFLFFSFLGFAYAGYKTVAISGAPDHVLRAGQPASGVQASIQHIHKRRKRKVEEEEDVVVVV